MSDDPYLKHKAIHAHWAYQKHKNKWDSLINSDALTHGYLWTPKYPSKSWRKIPRDNPDSRPTYWRVDTDYEDFVKSFQYDYLPRDKWIKDPTHPRGGYWTRKMQYSGFTPPSFKEWIQMGRPRLVEDYVDYMKSSHPSILGLFCSLLNPHLFLTYF